MKECLIDVLNVRNTVLHVFTIAVEDETGNSKAGDPEHEAVELARRMELVPEAEADGLHARPHVGRGGQLMPYADALKTKIEQCARKRAYFLWQQEGCPEDRAEEHWQRACDIERDGLT